MTTDLSCLYIKQNTHTETDVPVFFSFLPYHSFPVHPTNPPQLYPAKGRDNEKVGPAPELPLPLPCSSPLSSSFLSLPLCPPALLLHLVCITSHFHLSRWRPLRWVKSRSLGRQLSSAQKLPSHRCLNGLIRPRCQSEGITQHRCTVLRQSLEIWYPSSSTTFTEFYLNENLTNTDVQGRTIVLWEGFQFTTTLAYFA